MFNLLFNTLLSDKQAIKLLKNNKIKYPHLYCRKFIGEENLVLNISHKAVPIRLYLTRDQILDISVSEDLIRQQKPKFWLRSANKMVLDDFINCL
jgi:hypothetical protein